MSGDVQARKRREKKKKKEDGPEEVAFQQQHQPSAPTSPSVIDDLNIHIQKEASTGGGLCAKFVFFILLTVLTTLIGLIITEHRGLTDLDTIDSESRFAQIFEGWTDKSPLDHDSHDHLSIEESEEALDDGDDSHGHEDEDEASEEAEETASDEEEHNDEEDEDEEDDEEEEESAVQDDDTAETDEMSKEADDDDDSQGDDNEDEDDVEEEAEEYEDESEEQDNISSPTKEDLTQEEEEEEVQDDSDDKADQEDSEDRTDLEESEEVITKTRFIPKRDISRRGKVDLEKSEEVITKSKVTAKRDIYKRVPDKTKSEEAESVEEAEDDKIEKPDDDDDDDENEEEEEENEEDDDDEDDDTEKASEEDKTDKLDLTSKPSATKVQSEKRAKVETKKSKEAEATPENENPEDVENSNMVVKFGVGTALLVVAHVVLVRKWRTEKVADIIPQVKTEEVENAPPDLTRRNTIVTPPKIEEIEQDIENVEEEYSDDDEDESEDDGRSKPTRAKMRYQELQSTYSHTLTPDWEPPEAEGKDDGNYEEEDDEEQPEGDEDYDDEISENEDEELMRRLEAKYGKIQQSDDEPDDEEEDDEGEEEEEMEEDKNEKFTSWKRLKVPADNAPADSDSENEQQNWSKQRSGAQSVNDFGNITNSEDWSIQEELNRAQQNIANDAAFALTLFNKILERNPSSPRALYGKAQSLDALAERKRSNNLLQEAIATYQQVLKTENVPDALFQTAAERCIDRMRFRGIYAQAVPIHKLLIVRFPHTAKFANHLAVTYLTINKINEARKLLYETLSKWPNDGFALVHYGFILKTNDNDLKQAIKFLKKGIATKEPGVIDGRFYFHLGDALTRLGKNRDAMAVYEDGVRNKVFLSKYQRSLYNVDRLTGKPWWQKEDTPHTSFFRSLENNWESIRNEGLSILNKKGYFQPESENLRDVGDWKQFELFGRGIKNVKNCKQCPFTCSIIETFRDAIECRRGQIKFSVMHPGTHVWPHCGPTNCRLRAHLGLKVPLNTYIRVGEEIRSWKEGKLIIFDDSFEHEVWHNGTSTRLVLIVDFWHPELTKNEKRSLSSI